MVGGLAVYALFVVLRPSLADRRLAAALTRASASSVPMALAPSTGPRFEFAPFRLSGHGLRRAAEPRAALAALGDAVARSRRTRRRRRRRCSTSSRATRWSRRAAPVARRRPASSALEVGAALGLVIGRTACRVAEARCAGARRRLHRRRRLSVPHDELLPAVGPLQGARRLLRRSGRGAAARRRSPTPTRSASASSSTARLVHARRHRRHGALGVARLLADVSEFMTLRAGRRAAARRRRRRAAGRAPAQRIGDRDRRPRPARDAGSTPRRRRPPHEARPRRLRRRASTRRRPATRDGHAAPGRRPRASPRTRWSGCRRSRSAPIIALGLNYADHAKELAFKAPGRAAGVPQGPGRARSATAARRAGPADATFMHYECELAVVIGKHGAATSRGADAMRPRRRLHRRQRLRDPRLPRELVPAQPAREEPRRRHRARPVAGRRRRRRRPDRSSRCAPSSTARSRSRATRAT